ncbi:MAG: uroporphyrinogen-III synthase [Anaerolinea sp.]|nr:uroporphyrinogen-III synthase [Anaerolinea sp.]
MNTALKGRVIVNTRAAHQAEALNILLRSQGAIPRDYPCIAILPPHDSSPLDASLVELDQGYFDWLVLTSANTVWAVAKRLRQLGLRLSGQSFGTAVIGPGTAEAVQTQLGLTPYDLPPQFMAESLAEHLPLKRETRILLPESAIAPPNLIQRFSERGAVVRVVEAYQTVCRHEGDDMPQWMTQGRIDALTFTSASTVTCFFSRFKKEGGQRGSVLGLCVGCIGPKTAATARECGFTTVIVASEHTLNGLVDTLQAYFAHRI